MGYSYTETEFTVIAHRLFIKVHHVCWINYISCQMLNANVAQIHFKALTREVLTDNLRKLKNASLLDAGMRLLLKYGRRFKPAV